MPNRNANSTTADWDTVRTRLATAISATTATSALSAQQSDTVLRERARALARPKVRATAPGETVEALFFTLGSQPYAVELRFVHEMRKLGAFCRVPGLPAHFLGITSLRGEILPIVDLCLLLGMGASALGGEAHLVVMGMEGPEVAIVAAGVERTAPVGLHELLEAPEAPGGAGPRLVRGVTAEGWVFLDGRGVLMDERLFVGRAAAPAVKAEKP